MPESLPQTHSIFEQPWWLEATAPNQWDAVEVEESGRVVARLPFVYRKKRGLRIIGQAPLTPTLGPWIEHTSVEENERIAREKDLFIKLIKKLPKHDSFSQNFHPNITNWLPFYWNGYSQTTRYTYTLNTLNRVDDLYHRIRKSTRKEIRRAENRLTVVPDVSVHKVLEMAKLTFGRQNMRLPYPPELLERIDEAVTSHGLKVSLASVDQEGQTHSAVYVVGDERRMYLLVSGNDPELRRSQSGTLLRWEAIQAAAELTKVFDFEGSMLEGVEDFNRKFGANQTPYLRVFKHNRLVSGMLAIRRMLTP
ncbi:GNAT family N-acetyltransferase [Enteractinococcus fodinae]|uniref:Lipid II:glycine glycyltransferase (Peptidoglycan interpeptide bridge formation enzyme) n=1 Tax=Enteractinococcus fodinae TaxID=684663 RepID=A0ABU2B315_9MICC|nr:GNAT family N-acetyltransferase [Enteractinococcus fodinae]MDR7347993.1 lipid II:glycine glycyltransferase (peptidoglycan interpeptide bridge formation enzyme) [Enteractinococcus fodinae]